MSGSSPRPENVDESTKGALLGSDSVFGCMDCAGCCTFGLEVNKEEITCVGGRAAVAVRSSVCLPAG